MINKLNTTLKKVNKLAGVDIKIPSPTKKSLNSASIFAMTLGTVVLAAGVVTSSKWITLAGGVSLLNGVIQKNESNKLNK